MTQRHVRALVTGKVQGVSYRQATRSQALKRNISGFAKNLADGRVEVLMCGQQDAVTELSEWLWQGPPAARVSHVEFADADDITAPDDFATY